MLKTMLNLLRPRLTHLPKKYVHFTCAIRPISRFFSQSFAACSRSSTRHEPTPISHTVAPLNEHTDLRPTPIVMLTAPWGGTWCWIDTWQPHLADKGYHTTSIELPLPPPGLQCKNGEACLTYFVEALRQAIQTDHSYFPPLLVAHGFHALVAQRYVASHPASGLVLISPFIPSIIPDRLRTIAKELDPTIEVKTHRDLWNIPSFRRQYLFGGKERDEVPVSSTVDLPLEIYTTIENVAFEPLFPMMIVTARGDRIVTTEDVKVAHEFAGRVDQVELDGVQEGEGGHFVMIREREGWEDGPEGLVEWMDGSGI